MTREKRKEYNSHCTGEYRLYDDGTSWGVTLMSIHGEIKEVLGAGQELWDRVNALCGYKKTQNRNDA